MSSKLDQDTQDLLKLIFDEEMFKKEIDQMKLDTKMLSFENLNRTKIMNGYDVLVKIKNKILKISKDDSDKNNNLQDLSNQFYKIIPYLVPTKIKILKQVMEKMNMLRVLLNIESVQTLLKNRNYGNLQSNSYQLHDTELNLLKDSSMFNVIKQYVDNTTTKKLEIVNIWEVNILSKVEKFKTHEKISNRKLLWHGTDIASVASILLEGLNVYNPQFSYQYGDGIYFTSVFDKAAKYITFDNSGYGIVFLSEVALGKAQQTEYNKGCRTKNKAEDHYNSVIGQGRFEPDTKDNEYIYLDNKQVMVPIGKTVITCHSKFYHREYVIYDESQCRIRFLLLCKFISCF